MLVNIISCIVFKSTHLQELRVKWVIASCAKSSKCGRQNDSVVPGYSCILTQEKERVCKAKLFRFSYSYLFSSIHREKSFVESTQICLVQQNFSFKYGSMEILLQLAKKTLFTFFAIQKENKNCIVSKKIWCSTHTTFSYLT